ncbi:MAG TPA: hypothetical protein PK095_01915 [Myxococcota bacterium]|nr:hypothetical protein [Myxococcota bacterium]
MRIAALLSSLLLACQTSVELDDGLAATSAELRSALERADHAKLWELSDRPTKEALLDLFRQAEVARAQVPVLWPEADRKAALESLGSSLAPRLGADDEGRGARLLEASLDLEALTFNEDTEQGLSPRDVTFDPGPPRRALIATQAGERLSFVEDGGTWRSTLVRDALLERADIQALTEHVKKAQTLAAEHERLWRESADPRTPQGAYNLARAAQTRKPVDVDMLFALLDEDARKTLVDILEAARAAQKQIQQRTVKAARREAYRAAGILQLVDTTTDRELFRRWQLSPEATPLVTHTDEPSALEGQLASGQVTVLTLSGGRVPMRRDSDGFWRLAELRPALTKALSPTP